MIYWYPVRAWWNENAKLACKIPNHDMEEFCERFNVVPDPHGHVKLAGISMGARSCLEHLQTFKKKNHKGRYGRVLTSSLYLDIDTCKEDFRSYLEKLNRKWNVQFFRASEVNTYFTGLYQPRFGDPLKYWGKYRQRDVSNLTTIVFLEKDKQQITEKTK